MEYAKAEPEKTRGRTQALLQMVGTAGSFCAVVLVAFGFNGQMFTGSFSQRHQLQWLNLVSDRLKSYRPILVNEGGHTIT